MKIQPIVLPAQFGQDNARVPTEKISSVTPSALIVAAGRGKRAGSERPKQFMPLGGEPILARTLRACLASPKINSALVVIHPDDADDYHRSIDGISDPRLLPPVHGGASRDLSVRLGLEALERHAPSHVLIHDAARPFLTTEVIDRVLTALQTFPAAFPALPIVDAVWHATGDQVSASVARDDLWRAQTPQGFDFPKILTAHRSAKGPAVDDVALAHAAGLPVKIVLGDGNNFKITMPEDFARAERLLEAEKWTSV